MNEALTGLDKSELLVKQNEPGSPTTGLFSREAYVLGGGLKDGVAKGTQRALSDLDSFGESFASAPLRTLTDTVEKHWSQAAVAAAITFAAPQDWANALIAVASLRGVAGATLDSAALAANPGNDAQNLREHYAEAMSSETHAFISSLPMTLAGGMAGKVGANAVFGKGFGAWDAISGERSLNDIKNNLWDLHDKLLPPKAKLAVIDLDATLVSTNKHLALGIAKATGKVAENTGLSEQTVQDALYDQFRKLNTFASSWTTELALADKLQVGKPGGMTAEQFRSQVSAPYWQTLEDTAKDQLQVYDGVKDGLSGLNAEKIPVVILSNSAAEAVLPRMATHSLDAYADKIMALKNVAVPAENLSPELLQQGAERQASRMQTSGAEKLVEIPRELRKPNPSVLEQLIQESHLRPKQVIVIGDSLKHDMALAEATGTRGFWVRYSAVDSKYDSVMDSVVNYKLPESQPPAFEAELHKFSDVLKQLKPARDLNGFVSSIYGLPAWYTPVLSYGLAGHDR